MRHCLQYLPTFCLASSLLHADGPPFDLSGPKVDVRLKRGDVTLPNSETPNLLPGDRLWIHLEGRDNPGRTGSGACAESRVTGCRYPTQNAKNAFRMGHTRPQLRRLKQKMA
jgi:hypothetical protein